MRDLEDALEDGLLFANPRVSWRAPRSEDRTHRALVLDQQQDAMRFALCQLLEDMDKVDDAEEVAPREVGDELDLVVVSSFWRAWTSARRTGFEHGVFWSWGVQRRRVDPIVAVLEEAGAWD